MSSAKRQQTAAAAARLLDSDSDSEESGEGRKARQELVINKKYASEFQSRKQREELRKVRFELGGDDPFQEDGDGNGDDASTSASSSSEDEDGNLLTSKLDVDIMKTINALRNREERIYDPRARFFDGDDSDDNSDGSSASPASSDEKEKHAKKQIRYKEIVRQQVLERIEAEEKGEVKVVGDQDDDEDDETNSPSRHGEHDGDGNSTTPSRLAYDAEQRKIRQAFLESVQVNDDESGAGGPGGGDENKGGGWMKLKTKKASDRDEGEEHEKELLTEIQKLEDGLEKRKKNAPIGHEDDADRIVDPRGEVEDGEKFLLDFFKTKAWVEKDDDDGDVDNGGGDWGDDIGGDDKAQMRASGKLNLAKAGDAIGSDDESLDELEQADDFEARYNFRFEEAAAATTQSGADFSMTSYARVGQGVKMLRRKDETRREKRLARKQRKAEERKAKEEQLKRLKNAKRQEMEEKLKHVKVVLGDVERHGGSVDEAAIMKMIEGDFDPEKFEKLMSEAYGDDFYKEEDSERKTDEDVRKSLKQDEDGDMLVGEDDSDGGLYDCYEEGTSKQAEEETPSNRASGDVSDDEHGDDWPEEDQGEGEGDWDDQQQEESELEKKVKARMMDELYKLDYEDIVAGQPTRFKYRKVKPNNYGLSTEEILFARDKTLKQFVSLKKLAPYREDEHYVGSRKRRKFREMLKRDMEEHIAVEEKKLSTIGEGTAPEDESSLAVETQQRDAEQPPNNNKNKRKKNRRLKKGKNRDTVPTRDMSDEKESEEARSNNEPDGDRESPNNLKEKPTANDDSKGKGGVAEASRSADGERNSNVLEGSREKRKRKRNKKKKKQSVAGVSEARLASYAL